MTSEQGRVPAPPNATATQALRLGQSYDYSPDIGSLVSPAQLAAVEAHR
jgi:hypothetical protein